MTNEEYTELFYGIEMARDLEEIKKVLFELLNKVSDISDKLSNE